MIYLALYCIPIVVIQGIHIWEYVGWARIAARKGDPSLIRSYGSCMSRFWTGISGDTDSGICALIYFIMAWWPIGFPLMLLLRISGPLLPFREPKKAKPPKVGNYFYRREKRKLTEGRAEAGQMPVIDESTEGRVSWVSGVEARSVGLLPGGEAE